MENNAMSLAWETWESVWQGVMRADQMAWLDVQEMETVRRSVAHTAPFGPLAREAFLGLYGQVSGLVDTPVDSLRLIHNLMTRAEKLPEWQGLRAGIEDDPVAAAFGAAHFAFDLLDRLPEEVKEPIQQAAQAAKKQAKIQEQLEQFETLLEGMKNQSAPQEMQDQVDALREQAENIQAQSQVATQAAQEALDAAQARTAQACARALSDADGQLKDLKSAARAFGANWGAGMGQGSKQQLDALEQLAAYLRQSPMLKQILEELGWAKRLVSEQVRKSQQGRETFTHYQVGELNPEDLAPEEWVGLLLNDPASPLSVDFLARAYDDDLIHRRYEGQEKAGRGPIVFVRDTSGSMRSPSVKNATAAAVELALMQWALQEKRRFISIPFSGPNQFVVYDPGAKPDLVGLLEHLSFGYWSGTEPYAPLMRAIEINQTDPGMKQGDILILTDGSFGEAPAEFIQAHLAAKENPGLRIVAVVIGGQAGCADFADRVILIGDLLKDRAQLARAIGAIVQA